MSRNFDGVDDVISVNSVGAVNNLNTMSIAVWVNHDSVAADQGIVGKWGAASNFLVLLILVGALFVPVRQSALAIQFRV